MTKNLQTLALVFTFALASTAAVRTQEKPAAQPAKSSDSIPLKVQIVVSRYQGEKKVSSMPYNLSVNAPATNDQRVGHSNLRIGAKIPVMMVSAPVIDGKAMPTAGSVQYQDVGTNIDCNVFQPLDDGRFRLEITIDDSSVYGDGPAAGTNAPAPGNPSFRSLRASDSLILRNGQTAELTTAIDKVSGETVKVDVTLTVMK